jgi:UDP-N-acetylmuramate--alanine ligase
VTDIYPAGEKPMPGVSRSLVLSSLKAARVPAAPFTGALDVAKELREGDVLLTIGAGDVWKIGEDLRRRREEHRLAVL